MWTLCLCWQGWWRWFTVVFKASGMYSWGIVGIKGNLETVWVMASHFQLPGRITWCVLCRFQSLARGRRWGGGRGTVGLSQWNAKIWVWSLEPKLKSQALQCTLPEMGGSGRRGLGQDNPWGSLASWPAYLVTSWTAKVPVFKMEMGKESQRLHSGLHTHIALHT